MNKRETEKKEIAKKKKRGEYLEGQIKYILKGFEEDNISFSLILKKGVQYENFVNVNSLNKKHVLKIKNNNLLK